MHEVTDGVRWVAVKAEDNVFFFKVKKGEAKIAADDLFPAQISNRDTDFFVRPLHSG